jgi:tripartite-type tricarboxylate transporter receptor subunit TctC
VRCGNGFSEPAGPPHYRLPCGHSARCHRAHRCAAIGEQLGQPVVVENRPGAGTNLGTEFVVRATADGYTLLLVPVATAAANATLYLKLKFNFIRDIMPVASIGGSPLVLVATPSLPATTIPEFIAYAKSHPAQINMASTGVGTAPDLAAELFNMMAGVKLVNVPYRTNFMQDPCLRYH